MGRTQKSSSWKKYQNNPMYQDIQKYGKDKFEFQTLAEVEADKLKEAEQQFIETLKPTYNNYNAKGLDVERQKEYQKEYQKSDKYKEYKKEHQKEYQKSNKWKEYQKEYRKSDKYKEYSKEYDKEYYNQLCYYNNEKLTLCALAARFRRAGIEHPTQEAKKYIINSNK